MDLRRLKYFVAVAQEQSIGRAAIRLNISQPPLTRQIMQLEEEVGAQLFIRKTKGVELTQAGELLLQEALNILSLVAQTTERIHSAGQGKIGRIDVGIFGSGIHTVPSLLLNFRNANPGINIVIHTLTRGEQIEALRQRRLTIGFHRMLDPMTDIKSELVKTEPLLVAVNKQDPLAGKKNIWLREMADRPLVLYPTSARNYIDFLTDLCRSAGFTPRVSQEVNDLVTAIALVASGFGLCIVPEAATSLQLPDVVYLPVNDKQAIVDLSCMYRRDDESPILKAFLDVIKNLRQDTSNS
ncbi:LysR family transcriptional regulator [Pseudomonas fluorescens]|uniref:LysR substrate-binding domain-containing protein n=1 Tax=Pseudomonas fluorescens TaxID=294 RepID=UPI00054B259F|nr:LysR substrate-binding domain-containing protein [Pseudomonas fluorescens]KII27576.1 LysR family transcriptional regulator [Pseudomonas fluorescens]